MTRLEITAPDGLPEIGPGSDVAALIATATDLADGDIVVITSKVISKAEGRVRTGDRDEAIEDETERVVARRGHTRIVRNRLGLTMAAAGVDASNVDAGSVVLLPLDPDASARTLRARVHELSGAVVGVIITDTSGRAWREGQTDIAIGAAGLHVAEDFNGRIDPYGNPLVVTLTAVADELAGAAELAQGKLGRRPVAVVRGRDDLVLPIDDDGPGAASLIRPDGADLFGYGAREAVVRALTGAPDDRVHFGHPCPIEELLVAIGRVHGRGSVSATSVDDPAVGGATAYAVEVAGRPQRIVVTAVCFAHGWLLTEWVERESGVTTHVLPVTP